MAPYFLEEVRKHLESRYGAKQLYQSGLTVTTTLDVKLQEAANRAVERGLRQLDKRRGYRQPRRNVLEGRAHRRRVQGRPLGAADRARRRRPRRRRRAR